jgi:hypothetical protein
MGYLHHRALSILREIVTNLPKFSIEQHGLCKGWMLGKHAKVAFPSSEHRSKEILDIVHLNICGSMLVASISGSMYYVSFINDFIHKTWIYFLKNKDEVFNRFQEFKALVENQTGKKIKFLRSNNGGEYTCKKSDNFGKKEGIKRELTILYNPQHNGVAK